MVVANLVSQEGIGFESDENEVVLVLRTGEIDSGAARAQDAPSRSGSSTK